MNFVMYVGSFLLAKMLGWPVQYLTTTHMIGYGTGVPTTLFKIQKVGKFKIIFSYSETYNTNNPSRYLNYIFSTISASICLFFGKTTIFQILIKKGWRNVQCTQWQNKKSSRYTYNIFLNLIAQTSLIYVCSAIFSPQKNSKRASSTLFALKTFFRSSL